MRPRVFPAEDDDGPRREGLTGGASMRPRVFPAEDPGTCATGVGTLRASMRPRVFPAEDTASIRRQARPQSRFNEAAGIPRGRPSQC